MRAFFSRWIDPDLSALDLCAAWSETARAVGAPGLFLAKLHETRGHRALLFVIKGGKRQPQP